MYIDIDIDIDIDIYIYRDIDIDIDIWRERERYAHAATYPTALLVIESSLSEIPDCGRILSSNQLLQEDVRHAN